MHDNDIIADIFPIEGDFSRAWPKLVTAFLPGGETSQALFHEDGTIEVLGQGEIEISRKAG